MLNARFIRSMDLIVQDLKMRVTFEMFALILIEYCEYFRFPIKPSTKYLKKKNVLEQFFIISYYEFSKMKLRLDKNINYYNKKDYCIWLIKDFFIFMHKNASYTFNLNFSLL